MSKIIPMRLRDDEIAMLDHCCNSETNKLNRSELIRLLIRREYSRRTTRVSVVPNSQYSSDFRTGRPKKIKEIQTI